SLASRAPAPCKNTVMIRRLPQWDLTLIALTIAAGAWSAYLSPYYLNIDQIADSTRQFVYPGILALGLAVVVILGEIDISVASTLAFAPPRPSPSIPHEDDWAAGYRPRRSPDRRGAPRRKAMRSPRPSGSCRPPQPRGGGSRRRRGAHCRPPECREWRRC